MTETIAQRMKKAMQIREISQSDIVRATGIGKSSISTYLSGQYEPKQKNIYKIAKVLNVSEAWLMGLDVPMSRNEGSRLPSPTTTDDVVRLPVIGDIAAGFDKIANEDWSGETIEIPRSYLKGRPASDFTVLTVSGDSMYPLYHEGDKVVILKQPTLNRSGEIGAIVYEGECVSLKKIEYVDGEDWLKMISINPQYMPKEISGADLELCHIIGVPVLLIREIN